jgi:hypothetical protein
MSQSPTDPVKDATAPIETVEVEAPVVVGMSGTATGRQEEQHDGTGDESPLRARISST